MALLLSGLLGLFEFDIVAYIARDPFLGRFRGFIYLHFAFATLAGLPCKGRAAALRAEVSFAELFFHPAAHFIDAPAEQQDRRYYQYDDSHNEIEKKKCDPPEQRRGADSQDEDDQGRQRIALHEPHQAIYDRCQKIHSIFGLQPYKGRENYAYFN